MKRIFNFQFPIILLLLMGGSAWAQTPSYVTVGGNVFGGGNLANVVGNTTVLVNQSGAVVTGDVYGGGALAHVNTTDGSSLTAGKTTSVTLTQGTVGNVYGGGLGRLAQDAVAASGTEGEPGYVPAQPAVAAVEAKVFGPVTVLINGGTVTNNVYGCNNLNGSPQSTVQVDISGGTVTYDVFGGGNLASTEISPVVNINSGMVGQDVYGGGALANTGGSTVNVLGGTVSRDIYGGGLGDGDHAALVNGVVTVNIGALEDDLSDAGFVVNDENDVSGSATIGGSVYGCNNVNGTPKNNVFVNIYRTLHTSENRYPDPEPAIDALGTPAGATAFAITAVYGGGNQAAYAPNSNEPPYETTVHVYTCKNTIQTVYGGGNAADATKVHTIIDGGFFDRVFGGGNGYSATGNHTNRYILDGNGDPTSDLDPNYNPGANISVSATTEIHGGLYRQVFGGSNQYGDVANASLVIDKTSPCNELIYEAFGGANEAVINGNLSTTLACGDIRIGNFYGGSNKADINGNVTLNVYGGTYTNVFGGSKGTTPPANATDEQEDAASADINGTVTLNLFGGHMVNAFGGSDVNGNITGKITVNMLDFETDNCGLEVNNIYGGGQDAAYKPTTPGDYPEVNIIHGSVTKVGDLHGNVFGGGKGAGAVVTSNPKVTIGYDASMGAPGTENTLLYTLTQQSSTYTLPTTIYDAATSTFTPAKLHAQVGNNVYGGGDLAAVTGSTTVNLQKSNSSVASLFGGGNQASVGNTDVNVTGGSVSTGVYGGCNTSGTVGGTIDGTSFDGTIAVNIESNLGVSGTPLTEGIYGGGKGSATRTTGNVTVTIDKPSGDEAVAPVIYADVYGGSALGQVGASGKTVKVDFKDGSLNGVIYGGGKGQTSPSAIAAAVSCGVEVDVRNGSITGGVYGGCNYNGTVSGAIAVNVTGGTVGTDASHRASVFGGGYGSFTGTGDAVTVTIGDGSTTPTIYGDVYGGSAEGNVNDAVGEITKVWLKSGTVYGNIYGGGFGDNSSNALVNGSVQVVVDGGSVHTYTVSENTYGGSVFGCNNANGTPNGTVEVTINSTASSIPATYYTAEDAEVKAGTKQVGDLKTPKVYALQAVYGGGNLAHYDPTTPNDTYPKVTVNGCSTSIGDVFGGGNAAAVPNTNVIINGGDIDRVFAGGNGESGTPANIGHKNKLEPTTSDSYGSGEAKVEVKGGTIVQVFGGSNAHGVVRASGTVDIAKPTSGESLCEMHITDVYGGGNEAAGQAATISISCTGGATEGITNVYGGANAADVPGDIELTITGGRINNVFGGNNASGNVSGSITVNVEWDNSLDCGDGGKYLGNVYGGGNLAAYHPTSAGAYPAVNIKNGTVSQNVFGGGLGSSAKVYSNPVVTVGDLTPAHSAYVATVIGNVYGGGSAAMVGDDVPATASTNYTTVTIQKANSSVAKVFGGGMAAGVTGTTSVTITDGTVSAGLYGGCDASGTVVGNITVAADGGTIGTSDGNSYDGIFGGGYGSGTATSGNVTVTIGDGTTTPTVYGDVYGGSALGSVNDASSDATTVTLTSGTVNGNLYGGGLGRQADNSDPGNPVTAVEALVKGAVTVDVNGGTVNDVFGCNNLHGAPQSTVQVNINETVASTMTVNNVYGGGDEAAYVGDPDVNIIAGTVSGSVFGGGNNIATDNAGITNSDVVMTGGTVLGSIYGGCNEKGTVTGNSVVTIYGGTLGSQSRLEGGTLSSIFGGGLGENTAVNGNVTVTVSRASGDAAPAAPTIYGDVYGGSKLGSVNDAAGDQTTVYILDGTLKSYVTTLGGFNVYNGGNVYGGGLGEAGPANVAKGQVNGVVTVNIGAGTVQTSGFTTGDNSGNATIEGNVYGCNNTNGSPQQNVTVNIFKTAHTLTDIYSYTVDPVTNNITSSTIPTTYALQNVFGGGNQADFRVEGKTTTVNIYGCDNTIRRTFGGGNAAATNEVFTMIQGGYVAEAFSGGNGEVTAADVYGNVNLGIHGGKIGQIFGGSNQHGTISGQSNTTLESDGPCPGNTVVDEYFCGGKHADFVGNIVATITCAGGMTVNNLYGGCEEAHVKPKGTLGQPGYEPGNVTLTVYGGNYVNIYGGSKGTAEKGADIAGDITLNVYGGNVTNAIFGGSNIKGAVGGTITVNVEDIDNTDACPLDVSEADVYGGGNVADYPGVPESDGPLYNSGNPITHPSPYNYPEVNIKNATVKNVFGGGLNAAVTGNPQVHIKNKAKVLGNVYGGGNMGQVNGDPKVIINGKMN